MKAFKVVAGPIENIFQVEVEGFESEESARRYVDGEIANSAWPFRDISHYEIVPIRKRAFSSAIFVTFTFADEDDGES